MHAKSANSTPIPDDFSPVKSARSPKNDPPRPRKSYELELVQVQLSEVWGLDTDINEFFRQQDFNFGTVTDFKVWSEEAARWSYQVAPMILIRRKNGFDVLGTGRAWGVAKSLFGRDDSIPALVLANVKRVPTDVKFQIVAAELFALSADYRTRPNLPAALLNLWQQLNARGIRSMVGDDVRTFSQGTGYSLKALKPTNPNKSHKNKSDPGSGNIASTPACSFPTEPQASGPDA